MLSDELYIKSINQKKIKFKKFDFFELDNLNSKGQILLKQELSLTLALKKNFLNEKIYKKNLPKILLVNLLYSIAEKIRYETLGGKMLKGIEKNFKENYSQIINLKRKDQLKTKEDVSVTEAFELYMLKNFHNIKLNSLTNKNVRIFGKKILIKSIKETYYIF